MDKKKGDIIQRVPDLRDRSRVITVNCTRRRGRKGVLTNCLGTRTRVQSKPKCPNTRMVSSGEYRLVERHYNRL